LRNNDKKQRPQSIARDTEQWQERDDLQQIGDDERPLQIEGVGKSSTEGAKHGSCH
jgi:hypothetical protein